MPIRWEMPPVYLQSGDPEKENVRTLHAPGQLGSRFTIKQPTGAGTPGAVTSTTGDAYLYKRYQIVRSDSAMTASPGLGDVAWWSDKPNYVVTNVYAAGRRGQVAGVFQNNQLTYPITPGYYCCVQIGGRAMTRFTDGDAPDASGLFVIPGAADGRSSILTAGTAATYPVLGRTASGPIGGQSLCYVDLDVPETV